MALPSPIQSIAADVLSYLNAPSGIPPYSLYVYPPDRELAVRREMQELRSYLNANGITVSAVSLSDLFWQAIDESGFYTGIVEAERTSPNDEWTLDQIHASIREILTERPSLADRVIAAVDDQPGNCTVVLYRAGALYPAFRTSALLDDLRERLRRPVILLYPGNVVDPYGLKFMGRCEPTHGYRAKIYQRDVT